MALAGQGGVAAPDAGLPEPDTQPAPLYRYRFDGVGAVAIDDVSSADGVVVGGALLDGSGALLLDGNDDYVDLPNGIVSALLDATFSAWLVWNGNNCWHRIFSFGNTVEGEDVVGNRESELFATPVNCPSPGAATGFTALFERAATPADNAQVVTAADFGTGELRHAVLVFDGTLAEMVLYLDGVEVGRGASVYQLADVVDENNWLGRSQWEQDFNLSGSFASFEIYDVALTPEEVGSVFAVGPQ
jgi:hypothetical protein